MVVLLNSSGEIQAEEVEDGIGDELFAIRSKVQGGVFGYTDHDERLGQDGAVTVRSGRQFGDRSSTLRGYRRG